MGAARRRGCVLHPPKRSASRFQRVRSVARLSHEKPLTTLFYDFQRTFSDRLTLRRSSVSFVRWGEIFLARAFQAGVFAPIPEREARVVLRAGTQRFRIIEKQASFGRYIISLQRWKSQLVLWTKKSVVSIVRISILIRTRLCSFNDTHLLLKEFWNFANWEIKVRSFLSDGTLNARTSPNDQNGQFVIFVGYFTNVKQFISLKI